MNRLEVIERAIMECLDELYIRSQPSMTFDEVQQLCKHCGNDSMVCDKFYIGAEEQNDIIESYINAYHIHNEFHEDMDLVRTYLRDGGTKDKYIKPADGSPGYRGYEKVPPLKDLIGEEAANKALDLINECDRFYQPHGDENRFRFNVSNYGPSNDIEKVRAFWKKYHPDWEFHERLFDEETEEFLDEDCLDED